MLWKVVDALKVNEGGWGGGGGSALENHEDCGGVEVGQGGMMLLERYSVACQGVASVAIAVVTTVMECSLPWDPGREQSAPASAGTTVGVVTAEYIEEGMVVKVESRVNSMTAREGRMCRR
jgi:hypothetical protein